MSIASVDLMLLLDSCRLLRTSVSAEMTSLRGERRVGRSRGHVTHPRTSSASGGRNDLAVVELVKYIMTKMAGRLKGNLLRKQ